MEIKSRYEIIADLEEKKSKLLNLQANIGLTETNLRIDVEKAEERLKEFQSQKEIQLSNVKDQLVSIEKSLERLSNSQKKQN